MQCWFVQANFKFILLLSVNLICWGNSLKSWNHMLISGRMQKLPKPNWWSPTPSPHPALAALAQAPPPPSPWCTTWGPEANEPVFLLLQPSRNTVKPPPSPSLHLATIRQFLRLLNSVLHPPLHLPPTPSPALPLNWILGTWPVWGPLLLWSLPKPRPSRLCRRDVIKKRTRPRQPQDMATSWTQELESDKDPVMLSRYILTIHNLMDTLSIFTLGESLLYTNNLRTSFFWCCLLARCHLRTGSVLWTVILKGKEMLKSEQ